MSEQKTHAEIIAEMRGADNKCQLATKDGTGCYHCPFGYAASNCVFDNYADRLDAAHGREIDALKQRLAELDAEVAAKDEVIQLLNDEISEEQRRKMATAEKSSAVGNCAKLREALKDIVRIVEQIRLLYSDFPYEIHDIARKARAALAAPPRNCDKYPTFNDAIRALADKRGWHDAKWDSERYCILASWLLAPATEKEGGAK